MASKLNDEAGRRSNLERWIKTQPESLQKLLLTLVMLGLFGGSIGFGYFAWVKIPQIWDKVFILSLTGFFTLLKTTVLLTLPFLPLVLWAPMNAILHAMAESSEDDISQQNLKIQETQEKYEQMLGNTDDEGLIPLVTFSRLELSEYYQTGNKQMRKSFRYAVWSMWFGFAIIGLGVLLLYRKLSLPGTSNDGQYWLETIPIISGLVIEVVSALFLWIYRSTLATERYFYNRQVFIHNALLAFRIAKTTDSAKGDEAKELIIQNILDFNKVQSNATKQPLISGKLIENKTSDSAQEVN